ncbi:PPC domain-containing DNA-binding protein [Vibrio ostreicida]|uniref:DNA-binding protein n=1 Tax=Vibrio ostreicida TaxID=526588 RepID=A0ABT8BU16_9VIBR|nr:PPC domain-containing DNA-binding protein [Vibrio ostreicida]MDN3609650.1 DNA-binding protein [Vibrio ostreicida]NPD09518.1 DNA-binding protein [Vibrio ostreicida]
MIHPIAVRLTQGQDLKQTLHSLVREHAIRAGSIASCVGCLSQINMRLAGATQTLSHVQPYEIVSLMGTLTPEHQHIHIAAADAQGNVIGGHLLTGCIIDTTAELILHVYPHLTFSREQDDTTGYTELVVNSAP